MPGTDRELSIGVDIGATNIRVAVVDGSGAVLDSRRMRSWEHPEMERNIERLVVLVEELVAAHGRQRIAAVGMGLPGTVDDQDGTVVYTPNLRWHDVPLGPMVRERTGLPVHLIQDTKAAVWGEYLYGAGRGHKNVVCGAIGSGFSCGIIIDGRLYAGARNTAGEIGHLHLEDDGLPCGCGKRGCMEAYASGLGLPKLFRRELARARGLIDVDRYPPDQFDAPGIFAAAKQGDIFCRDVIDKMARYAAKGLSMVSTILAPDILILSGGLSRERELLFEPIKQYLFTYTYHSARETMAVELAQLGEDAPLIGAAALHRAPGYGDDLPGG